MQVGTDQDKTARIENSEFRIQQLENSFNTVQEALNKKLNGLREAANKLTRFVEDESNSRDLQLDKKTKEIYALDQQLSQILDEEIQNRKELEIRLLRQIEERVNNVRQELANESHDRQLNVE